MKQVVLYFSLYLVMVVPAICQTSEHEDGIFYKSTNQPVPEEIINRNFDEKFKLFGPAEILDLTISSDFRNLIRRKHKDEWQKAFVLYEPNDSIIIKRELKITARGNFRKSYCYMPPVKLNFKKTTFRIEELNELRNIKLVTVCKNSKTFEQYILKEYLIYRIFNLLTEKSYIPRLVRLHYEDISGRIKAYENFAFMIEENKQLTERNNAILLDKRGISNSQTDPEQETLVSLFQYMIGNTDWYLPSLHNAKLLKLMDFKHPEPYIVPYDFDYTGLVNAHYAVPNEKLPIKDIKERLFMGECRSKEDLEKILDLFRDKKGAIYDLINNFPYLDQSNKTVMINYLESFYKEINSDVSVKKNILERCSINYLK